MLPADSLPALAIDRGGFRDIVGIGDVGSE